MKNFVLTIVFALITSFGFANEKIEEEKKFNYTISEIAKEMELMDKGYSLEISKSTITNLSKFECVACEIDFVIVQASTGTVVGGFTVTVEVCGGTAASQQSACEWTGRILQALYNS